VGFWYSLTTQNSGTHYTRLNVAAILEHTSNTLSRRLLTAAVHGTRFLEIAMASPSSAPSRAFALGSSTGNFPTATDWLSFVNSGGSLTIKTIGGDSVVLNLPSGMYPIRAKAVTALSSVSNIVGWWA